MSHTLFHAAKLNKGVKMKKIKVGLLGLGKTGRIVAKSLLDDNKFDLLFVIKKNVVKARCAKEFNIEPVELLPTIVKKFQPDCLIDFTVPEATMENIKYVPKNCGIVIATTGFSYQQLSSLRKKKGIKILHAPNISDGINIMIKACKMLNRLWPQSDAVLIEHHFKAKKDAPSGTAKKIADALNKINVHIHSVRAGGIIGIHEAIFATQNQKIVLKHESFTREVFADGAKKAVKWLLKQKNGFYDINEMYE